MRFNLSKSGVGVSCGIKGFRIGTGPKGNYVHMGGKGVYYRATLSKPTLDGRSKSTSTPENRSPNFNEEQLQEIESADTATIVDSSSAELVNEMNHKSKLVRYWPFVFILGILLSYIVAKIGAPVWIVPIVLIVTVILTVITNVNDRLKKTTVMFYQLDSDVEALYQKLHDSFQGLMSCASCWHISAEGDVKDRKRHAGASSLVRRSAIRINKGNPPFVKSNILALSVPVGKQNLYFFPDKILVFEPKAVGAVSYKQLQLLVSETRFIEEGSVPPDATIVDRTWKYVNKKGGPDKRFKDNRELPIVLYEEINFISPSGLKERIQASRAGIGQSISESLNKLSTVCE
jgi:hypothetical protein